MSSKIGLPSSVSKMLFNNSASSLRLLQSNVIYCIQDTTRQPGKTAQNSWENTSPCIYENTNRTGTKAIERIVHLNTIFSHMKFNKICNLYHTVYGKLFLPVFSGILVHFVFCIRSGSLFLCRDISFILRTHEIFLHKNNSPGSADKIDTQLNGSCYTPHTIVRQHHTAL